MAGLFRQLPSRLEAKSADVRERPVLYVAFGDSVTQGCMEYATIDPGAVYHARLKQLIEQRYPLSVLSVINAGVSGDTAEASRPRWERDLLGFSPDLVTIGFGVNDAHGGPGGLAAYKAALLDLIEIVRTRTEADILLLTPTGMMTADNANVHDADRPALETFLRTAEEGWLQLYRDAVLETARMADVPVFDACKLWFDQAANRQNLNLRLANGINHPDRNFHQLLAAELDRLLFAESQERSIS